MNNSSKIISVLNNRQLLELIGRYNPAIFDLLPRHRQGEPPPLPWREAGADLGRMVVQMAYAAQRSGGKPEVVFDVLDEWCPVGKPLPIPFPWGGPWGDRPPRPDEKIDMTAVHLGLAQGLALAGAKVQDKQINAIIDKAIERSLAAVS